jgi:hypothetical protein
MISFRALRQLRVILLFAFFGIAIIVALYYTFVYVPPSCFDGKLNQGEEGIDCGGQCATPCEWEKPEPIETEWSAYFKKKDNFYDLVARIRNKNNRFGSGFVPYVFIVKDKVQNVLKSVEGNSYIAPGQTGYIIETKIKLPEGFDTVTFRILDDQVKWEKPSLNLAGEDFKTFTRDVRRLYNEAYFAEGSGTVRNQTSYNFGNVEISVVLYNKKKSVITVARTDMQDLKSGEEREFKVLWPEAFPIEDVDYVEVVPRTNVFSEENFKRNL